MDLDPKINYSQKGEGQVRFAVKWTDLFPMISIQRIFALIILFIGTTSLCRSQNFHKLQINFETNTYTLTAEQQLKIDSVINRLSTIPQAYKVDVIGHSDTTGSASLNDQLSLKRGEATKNYFVTKGFSKSTISVSGKGYYEPLDDNSTEEGQAANRRVTISISINFPKNINIGGIKLKENRYTIKADSGAVIRHPSGTSLVIPPQAFTDKNGKPVSGDIQIVYSEYHDPVDFILAGIPMGPMAQGKSYRLNSAGMLKIRAYKNGVPVYLKRTKSIRANFLINADMPGLNLYRFDSLAQRWIEIAKLTDELGSWMDPFPWRMYCGGYYPTRGITCSMDQCSMLYFLNRLGTRFAGGNASFYAALAKNDKLNTLPTVRTIRFHESIRATLKYQMDSVNRKQKVESRIYKITKIKANKRRVVFNVRFASKIKTDVDVFKNINWKFYTGTNEGYAGIFENKKWISCDVTKAGKRFTMVLKDSSGQVSLTGLKMRRSGGLIRREPSDHANALFEQYQAKEKDYWARMDELNEARREFQARSDRNAVPLDSLYRIPYPYRSVEWFEEDSLYCFLYYTRSYLHVPPPEDHMFFADWFNYFDAHKPQMFKRYSAIKNDTDFERCVWREKENEALRKLYDSAYKDMEEEKENKIIKSVNISKLGVYNFASLEQLKNTVEVIADFKDRSGKVIAPILIYVVDHSINGMSRYEGSKGKNPYRFSFDPASENTLIAIDATGASYIFRSEEFSAIETTTKVLEHTFVIDKIKTFKTAGDMKKQLFESSRKK